jgi:phage shock protein C
MRILWPCLQIRFGILTMYRSFTDRVFGGVCGGLSASFHVNAWLLRVLFVLFAIFSRGVGVALYLAMWWAMPQESLIAPRRSSPFRFLFVLLIIVILVGVWLADLNGTLPGPDEQPMLWPAVLMVLSSVFLLQQVRGT